MSLDKTPTITESDLTPESFNSRLDKIMDSRFLLGVARGRMELSLEILKNATDTMTRLELIELMIRLQA